MYTIFGQDGALHELAPPEEASAGAEELEDDVLVVGAAVAVVVTGTFKSMSAIEAR